jgi:hypothetical protein
MFVAEHFQQQSVAYVLVWFKGKAAKLFRSQLDLLHSLQCYIRCAMVISSTISSNADDVNYNH